MTMHWTTTTTTWQKVLTTIKARWVTATLRMGETDFTVLLEQARIFGYFLCVCTSGVAVAGRILPSCKTELCQKAGRENLCWNCHLGEKCFVQTLHPSGAVRPSPVNLRLLLSVFDSGSSLVTWATPFSGLLGGVCLNWPTRTASTARSAVRHRPGLWPRCWRFSTTSESPPPSLRPVMSQQVALCDLCDVWHLFQ